MKSDLAGLTDAFARGFRLGDRVIEPTLRSIVRPDGELRVEPRVMEVLLALARRAGDTVSRDELIEAVWKHPHVTDEALSRCISLLRQALGDDRAQPRFVETIPKRGYRLMVPAAFDVPPLTVTQSVISLAVLPFLNLSGDPAEEHLADGITELLIANLACMSSLRVISRTSAMHFKGSRARLTEIARELDVSRVVEGSVLRSGTQLQVVVQLIDPATDMHLFARTYTRALSDVLRLQNEIAWKVAEEIGTTLKPLERERLPRARALNEDAMQAYLRARHFWAQRTPDGFQRAIREYETCIAIEPEFAPAFAGLADTLMIMGLYGVTAPASLSARARELADRALVLDGDSAEALSASGGVALFFEWNIDAAQTLLRRALEVNSSHDVARLCLADALMFRGDFDAGMRELQQAVSVNPLDLGLQMNVGDFLFWMRRYGEAVTQLQHTLELGPHFWPARCLLAESFAMLGDAASAKQQFERASHDVPPARLVRSKAFVHATLGEREPALALLRELEAARALRYVPPTEIARGYAALGDADQAFRWIDLGIEERTPRMLMLGISVGYDRIKDDPRFSDRLTRIGIPG